MSIDLLTAFMIGFLGSLHCIGMCGPIAFALPLKRTSVISSGLGILVYNSGRLLTYALLGLVMGLIGGNILVFGWQQGFSIALGVLIVLLAIIPGSLENRLSSAPWISRLLSQLKSRMGFYFKKSSWSSLFGIGFLNGLLPCGLVYFALLVALASYGAVEGALYMLAFGAGTLPMMVAAAYAPGFVGVNWRNKIRRAIPYFAVVIGLLFILRGMNLGIPYVSPQVNSAQPEAVECHE